LDDSSHGRHDMRLIVGFGLIAFATAIFPAYAFDVTGCGQLIPPHTTGRVRADIDCHNGSALGALVDLGDGATLALNGHTVSGGVNLGATVLSAKVSGPGTLNGTITAGRTVLKIDVRHLVIHAVGSGLFVDSGNTTRVRLKDVSIDGASAVAVTADQVDLTDVDVNDNPASRGFAVLAYSTLRGTRVTANHNGTASPGCTGCSALLSFGTAKLTGVQATGNAGYGVLAISALRLAKSTVTGNDGSGAGIDIAASGRLRISRTTCGLSGFADPPFTAGYWHVCTND